jgi:hypothetical protein
MSKLHTTSSSSSSSSGTHNSSTAGRVGYAVLESMQNRCYVPELSLTVSDSPLSVPLTPIAPPVVPADDDVCSTVCGMSTAEHNQLCTCS